MKLLDWLARLGILRYGTRSAVYRSGRERPVEFQMEGVFDARRDLAPSAEPPVQAAAGPSCPHCQAALPRDARFCTACGRRLERAD